MNLPLHPHWRTLWACIQRFVWQFWLLCATLFRSRLTIMTLHLHFQIFGTELHFSFSSRQWGVAMESTPSMAFGIGALAKAGSATVSPATADSQTQGDIAQTNKPGHSKSDQHFSAGLAICWSYNRKYQCGLHKPEKPPPDGPD